jgi:hypothetical protein
MNQSEFIEQFARWFDSEHILQLARQTRWHLRQGKIKAFEFLVGLVFGEMSALRLSLNSQASSFTEPVSRQAVDQRYHERTVKFFEATFGHCLQQSLAQKPPRTWTQALAEHFPAIHVVDSTSFDCPESLAKIYPGCGGDASRANCKMLLRYEYLAGQFEPLALLPGKRSDQGLAVELPALLGAQELMLIDKGFLKLEVLRQIDQKKAYFLLPLPRSLGLRLAQPAGSGQPLDVADALRHTEQGLLEWPLVYLGAEAVAVRMVAFRLSEESAARHRAALREHQRKQGRVPTADALELAGWLILITNAPADKLPTKAMSYLYRVRWQIELVFKQCKSVLRLDVTQADKNSYRIQCEIWGRLIAAVVVFAWHSYLQAVCWAGQRRELSFAQLACQLQQHGMTLAQSLIQGGQQLRDYLWKLLRHLLRTTVKGRQRKRKTTWQNLEEHWLDQLPN